MKLHLWGVISAVLLSTFNSTVHAATIRVDLIGQVTSFNGYTGSGGGVFNIGDTISYSMVFDEAPNVSQTGARFTSISSFNGSVGSYNFAGNTGDALASNDSTSAYVNGGNPFDQISFGNSNLAANQSFLGLNRSDFTSDDGLVSGVPLSSFLLGLTTTDTSFLSSNDLSIDIFNKIQTSARLLALLDFSLDFNDQATGNIEVGVNGSFNSISVTNLSAVPLPAAAWLFGSGLVSLIGFSQRRKGACL